MCVMSRWQDTHTILGKEIGFYSYICICITTAFSLCTLIPSCSIYQELMSCQRRLYGLCNPTSVYLYLPTHRNLRSCLDPVCMVLQSFAIFGSSEAPGSTYHAVFECQVECVALIELMVTRRCVVMTVILRVLLCQHWTTSTGFPPDTTLLTHHQDGSKDDLFFTSSIPIYR